MCVNVGNLATLILKCLPNLLLLDFCVYVSTFFMVLFHVFFYFAILALVDLLLGYCCIISCLVDYFWSYFNETYCLSCLSLVDIIYIMVWLSEMQRICFYF